MGGTHHWTLQMAFPLVGGRGSQGSSLQSAPALYLSQDATSEWDRPVSDTPTQGFVPYIDEVGLCTPSLSFVLVFFNNFSKLYEIRTYSSKTASHVLHFCKLTNNAALTWKGENITIESLITINFTQMAISKWFFRKWVSKAQLKGHQNGDAL